MSTKPTPPPTTPPAPQTWLAEAAAWLLAKINQTQTGTAYESADLVTGRHVLVFGPERVLDLPKDPPACSYIFANPRDFAEWVAQHQTAAAEAKTGPSGQPWHPAVYVGPKQAQFVVDPYTRTRAALELCHSPAFDLLQKLEAKQEWQNQKAVHELARLDLARILAPSMADSLSHVAFQVAQQTVRQVGPGGDRGIRQYTQEQQPAADGRPAPLALGAFEIDAPVFVWPDTMTVGGIADAAAKIRLDLAQQIDDAGQPLFRLAPIVGQCRLARLAAMATVAGLITNELDKLGAEGIPVYLAQQ